MWLLVANKRAKHIDNLAAKNHKAEIFQKQQKSNSLKLTKQLPSVPCCRSLQQKGIQNARTNKPPQNPLTNHLAMAQQLLEYDQIINLNTKP
jgi:hypothetical protein